MKKCWMVALLMLASCHPAEALFLTSGTWRYKITVTVDTPEGVKTGFAVREVSVTERVPLLPQVRADVKVKGEAVAVDLGKRGVLFALLRSEQSVDHAQEIVYGAFPFAEDYPISNEGSQTAEAIRYYRSLKGAKAVLKSDNYPMLVRFTDITNPKTVEKVDPASLEASFGKGVKLEGITIEMTDEEVTVGVGGWLKWLVNYRNGGLDGSKIENLEKPTIANMLGAGNFTAGVQNER